jgi:AcrR family transcriptional regulator
MSDEHSDTSGSTSRARARLVEAAADLFYSEGIRGVPVERVLAQAGVTRSTLYRYFDSKEDLVVAYIQREDASLRAQFATASASAATPAQLLQLVVDTITRDVCRPGFRGCPFINAAVEYPDAGHPVRAAVRAHRSWFQGSLQQLLEAAGHDDAERAARALVTLRDGAMMGGNLDDPDEVAAALRWAVPRVVAQGSAE